MMQLERPRSVDREVIEDFQHNSWLHNPHTINIFEKLDKLLTTYEADRDQFAGNFKSDTDSLVQLKLLTNKALLLRKIITYVRENSFDA